MSTRTENRWKRAKRQADKDLAELLEDDLITMPTKGSEHNLLPPATPSDFIDIDCLSCDGIQDFDPHLTCNQSNLQENFQAFTEPSSPRSTNETNEPILNFLSVVNTLNNVSPTSIQMGTSFSAKSDPQPPCEDSNENCLFDDEASEDDSPDSSLRAALIVWALQHKIGRNALTDLLHILKDHSHPHLPSCSKTLMTTPRSTVHLFTSLGNGLFWYYGILQCLIPRLSSQYLEKHNNNGTVLIDIFVDGVSPYKSVKKSLWPICGCLAGSWDIFIIGLWCGVSKEPSDLQMFFEDFIKEASELIRIGFSHLGFQLRLRIRRIIADAPARTWIKNVNQHGSYFACERCTAEGIWFGNRITYPLRDVTEERTDESLAQRIDERYHKGLCPLTQLDVKLISQMPLEALHLLWLGVTKRILMKLLSTKRNTCQYKFSETLKENVDSMSLYISKFYPSDFARRPRKWTDHPLYKGSDYRRIALYDGFILLKTDGVNQDVYKNFCLFACAIRILSDPEYLDIFHDDAQMLLEKFIESSVSIYDKTFNVYNVHHLRHLTEDCKRHGDLESFSAFKFESHLGVLKRLLHAPGRTLPQIVCRLLEQISNKPTNEIPKRKNIEVFMPCELPETVRHLGNRYRQISIHHKRIKMSAGKSFFLSTERKIVHLSYIIKTSESYLLVGESFRKRSDYFKYPVHSSALDIYEVEELNRELSFLTINQVKKKCVVIPIPSKHQPLPEGYYDSKCLALPMPHGGDQYHTDLA